MMGLVRLALRRPYTSAIVAFIIMLGGAMSITRMIVDIFPVIDIPVTLGDVAKVGGSFANQTNIVHVNGDRATYVTILRHADASTLAVVEATKAILPDIKAAAQDGLDMSLDFDQSVFVSSAIQNVLEAAVISSVPVSLMILVPGSFTYAILRVPVPSFPQIPVAALNQRGGVQQVAVVGEDAVVKFRPIRISSTDGVVINVADGVKAGEQVALNVPNEVIDGTKVRPSAGR